MSAGNRTLRCGEKSSNRRLWMSIARPRSTVTVRSSMASSEEIAQASCSRSVVSSGFSAALQKLPKKTSNREAGVAVHRAVPSV